MTIATWKAEFYPVDAADVSAEDAAAHSLRKWEGLLPEALARHGVELRSDGWEAVVVGEDDEEELVIDGSSCALCERFYGIENRCGACPLSVARGGCSCTQERDDEEESPWDRWGDARDPAPMIHWLKVTVEAAKAAEAAS